MSTNEVARCPECGSEDLIPRVEVTAGHGDGRLAVGIAAHPNAFLFKGMQHEPVTATVCGKCGLVRFFVNNPQHLLATYQKQTGEASE